MLFVIEYFFFKLLYIEFIEVFIVFVFMEELDMKFNWFDLGFFFYIFFLELDIVCNLMWEMIVNIFLLCWLVGLEWWFLIILGCLFIFDGYLVIDLGIVVRDLFVLWCLGFFNVF